MSNVVDFNKQQNPWAQLCTATFEIECAVIGTLIYYPAVVAEVRAMLRAEQFGEGALGRIYQTIIDCHDEHGSADGMLVLSRIGSLGDGINPREIFARCAAAATIPEQLGGFVQEVIAGHGKRQIYIAASEAAEGVVAGADPFVTARHLVECGDTVLAESRALRPSSLSADEMFAGAVADMDTEAPTGVTTGLGDLDGLIGGFRPSELVIIGARPSMGKTTLMTSSMLRAARAGAGVACFSLEMDRGAVAARCLSDLAWNRSSPVTYAEILNRTLDDRQKDRIRDAFQRQQGLPMEVDDNGGLTIAEISARARRLKERWERNGRRLDVIFVDYLGLIQADNRYAGQRTLEVGQFSAGLKAMAKDLGVCVVALHQLNRQVEQRDDKRPYLADLRDSGNIEQDADIVIFLYREHYYLTQHGRPKSMDEEEYFDRVARLETELELIVSKNRNGRVGVRKFYCDMASSVVRDRQYGE